MNERDDARSSDAPITGGSTEYFLNTWRVMLALMLIYMLLNFLLPCPCVFRRADPRGPLLLVVACSWMCHLAVSHHMGRRLDLRRGLIVGFLFFVASMLVMPM